MKFSISKFIFAAALAVLAFGANEVKADEVPEITNVSPSFGTLGSPFTITVTGGHFKSSQGGGAASTTLLTHYVYGVNKSIQTTVISGTLLTAVVPGNLQLFADGGYYITVYNSTPQPGVYSNDWPFTLYNAPPTADNLFYSYYCSSSASTIDFSWTYNDSPADSDNQEGYYFQVDDNSNFGSPEVDRISLGLNNPPGVVNHELVEIRTDGGIDSLRYGVPYYWRVKVWQRTVPWENPDPNVEKPLNSGWVNGNLFTTIDHPGPYAYFSFTATSPSAIFTNHSACYDEFGNEEECISYSWNFGDGTGIYGFSAQKFQYSYNAPGTYYVTLTVTDSSGLQCSDAKSLNAPNPPGQYKSMWKEVNPYQSVFWESQPSASPTPTPTPTPTPSPSPPP